MALSKTQFYTVDRFDVLPDFTLPIANLFVTTRSGQ